MRIDRFALCPILFLAIGFPSGRESRLCAQTPGFTPVEQTLTPEEMAAQALEKINTGDFDKANDLIYRASRLKPDLPKLKLAQGLLAANPSFKRYAEALQVLEAYCATDEGRADYRGFATIGKIYKDAYNYRQASRPLDLAKKLAADQDPAIRAQIGMDLAFVYAGLGKDAEQAMTEAKEAAKIAASDPKIQLQLAQVFVKTKDPTGGIQAANKAIDLFRSTLVTNPFNLELNSQLLVCYQLKSDLHRAQSDAAANDAAKLFFWAETQRDLAEAQRRINLLSAREIAIRATDVDPKNSNAQILLAEIEFALGALQDARDRVDAILNTEPTNQAAQDLKAQIQARLGSNAPAAKNT